MKKLKVNEIFYSLQAEGANSGTAAVFVRLSGCNKKCEFCDTQHEEGKEMSIDEIMSEIKRIAPAVTFIIFTGGEPLLQLEPNHIQILREYFPQYELGLETNGTLPVSDFDFSYISCSPKVSPEHLCDVFLNHEIDELRYPIAVGETPPDQKTLPMAYNYYISPKFDGLNPIQENIDYCVEYVKQHPEWQLSVQNHKLWKIL